MKNWQEPPMALFNENHYMQAFVESLFTHLHRPVISEHANLDFDCTAQLFAPKSVHGDDIGSGTSVVSLRKNRITDSNKPSYISVMDFKILRPGFIRISIGVVYVDKPIEGTDKNCAVYFLGAFENIDQGLYTSDYRYYGPKSAGLLYRTKLSQVDSPDLFEQSMGTANKRYAESIRNWLKLRNDLPVSSIVPSSSVLQIIPETIKYLSVVQKFNQGIVDADNALSLVYDYSERFQLEPNTLFTSTPGFLEAYSSVYRDKIVQHITTQSYDTYPNVSRVLFYPARQGTLPLNCFDEVTDFTLNPNYTVPTILKISSYPDVVMNYADGFDVCVTIPTTSRSLIHNDRYNCKHFEPEEQKTRIYISSKHITDSSIVFNIRFAKDGLSTLTEVHYNFVKDTAFLSGNLIGSLPINLGADVVDTVTDSDEYVSFIKNNSYYPSNFSTEEFFGIAYALACIKKIRQA